MAERTQPIRPSSPQPPEPSTTPTAARFDLPAETFALAALFERVPDAQVELEPAVANPDDHALLSIRTEEHRSSIDTALEGASDVAMAECFGERTDGWTYRVTWQGRPRELIRRFEAARITIWSARGVDGRWTLRLVAPYRDSLSTATEIMDELGCDAECRRISAFEGKEANDAALTDAQREALVTAFENGYYNIPRDIHATDLADELDISHQALSERLRRAHRELINSTTLST